MASWNAQENPKAPQKKEPLAGYNFLLRAEARYDLACKSVRAFRMEQEYDYIQEGGQNDYVHIRRKPVSRPPELEVERYVASGDVDPLPLGAVLEQPLLLLVSRKLNQFEKASRSYAFKGCVVTAKEYKGMDALSSELLTEKVTIAYQELLVEEEKEG